MKYQYDDGGRLAAGFSGKTGDCVARAVAIATGLPYADVYKALADVNANARNRKTRGERSARRGVRTSSVGFKRYMASIGWRWTPTMFIGQGCKVHLRPDELPSGRLIVSVSRHYTAVIDGVIHDTHDPQRLPFGEPSDAEDIQGSRCVYGYWSNGMDPKPQEKKQ